MEEIGFAQPELVGREEELAVLERFLDDAVDGKGSTIYIAGEAGIGKTRKRTCRTGQRRWRKRWKS